jgi:hypothetical protein
MSEFGDIVAHPLTTLVCAGVSLLVLAAYTAVTLLLVRRRSRCSSSKLPPAQFHPDDSRKFDS